MDFNTTYDANEGVWRGGKFINIFNSDCSIGRIAQFMMSSKPADAICQICDSEKTELTFDTACKYAIRIAQHLQKMGFTHNDVVGVVAPNTTMLMPAAVGCWMNCTPIHPLNAQHEESVIRHIFGITKPRLIFCDGQVYDKLKRATSDLNVTIYTLCNHVEGVAKVEDLLAPTMSEHFFQAKPLVNGCDQTMVIMCTSGTTGMPKAALISNARICIEFGLSSGPATTLSFSTPDWSTGMLNMAGNVMNGGIRLITTKPFTPEYMIDLVRKYKVSVLGVSSTQISSTIHLPEFTAENLQSIKLLFFTGGHCSPKTLQCVRNQIRQGVIINSYGSTEFGSMAANIITTPKILINGVGKIAPNVEVKIIDEQTGKRLAHNDIGEIYVRKEIKWLGYFDNKEATKDTMTPDGWIRTGDLGYMDDDNNLHLKDRNKDILKYNGMQFWPHEIEETISEMPDVVDVCVFGVFDERFGDSAAAAVVKKAGSELLESDVVKYVEEKKEVKHKHLNYGAFFVNGITRNANGKVMRNKVMEMCLEMSKLKTK